MSVKVFTAAELLEAVKKDASSVLQIIRKKEPKKVNGTEFFDAKWSVAGLANKDGWFSAENIELSDGIADPNNKLDKRNQYNKEDGTSKMRLQLQTSLSRSGPFGQALNLLNPVFRAKIETLIANKQIPQRKIHDMLQYKLSDENEKNPGAVIEDPVIRFHIDFTNFSPKYPHAFLQNQPKTIFYDARTEFKSADGKCQYKEATVEVDGKTVPVNADNVHLFANKGSKIVSARFMIPSIPVSQHWVSIPISANKVVLLPGVEGGFSDEIDNANNANAALAESFAAPKQETKETKEPVNETTMQEQNDAVNDLLADLTM